MPQSTYQAFRLVAQSLATRHIAVAWQDMITDINRNATLRRNLIGDGGDYAGDSMWRVLYNEATTLTSVPRMRAALLACVRRYELLIKGEYITVSSAPLDTRVVVRDVLEVVERME